MNRHNDYLSEFEREFESDDALAETSYASDDAETDDSEWEHDYDGGSNDSFEMPDDSYEMESGEDEYEDWAAVNGDSREREFENRLYEALNSDTDNEFEQEMEVSRVLHEMEQDYFFKPFGKLAKKYGLGLIKNLKGGNPLGMAVKALSKVDRGFIQSALKSPWLGKIKNLTSLVPGYGPLISKGLDMATKLANSEVGGTGVPRSQVRQAVQVGKQAYQNLAVDMLKMRDPKELGTLGKKAFGKAVSMHGGSSNGKTVIAIPPGAIVVVGHNKVVIRQPKRS